MSSAYSISALPCPANVPRQQWEAAHRYVKITIYRATRNLPYWIDREQVAAAGWLALWKAGELFEPERGLRFSTFLTHKLRGALLEEAREQAWGGRWGLDTRRRAGEREQWHLELDQPIILPACDGKTIRYGDAIAAPVPEEPTLPRYWLAAALVLQELTAEEQAVLWAVLGEGLTYDVAGERLGLSTQKIERRLRQARARLEEVRP